jgi:hypothetical protein
MYSPLRTQLLQTFDKAKRNQFDVPAYQSAKPPAPRARDLGRMIGMIVLVACGDMTLYEADKVMNVPSDCMRITILGAQSTIVMDCNS